MSGTAGSCDNHLEPARTRVTGLEPGEVVRVVREVDGQREGAHLRWGLIPYWAKGKPMGNTINARIETVTRGTIDRVTVVTGDVRDQATLERLLI
mgnify:CR=1 FL=1